MANTKHNRVVIHPKILLKVPTRPRILRRKKIGYDPQQCAFLHIGAIRATIEGDSSKMQKARRRPDKAALASTYHPWRSHDKHWQGTWYQPIVKQRSVLRAWEQQRGRRGYPRKIPRTKKQKVSDAVSLYFLQPDESDDREVDTKSLERELQILDLEFRQTSSPGLFDITRSSMWRASISFKDAQGMSDRQDSGGRKSLFELVTSGASYEDDDWSRKSRQVSWQLEEANRASDFWRGSFSTDPLAGKTVGKHDSLGRDDFSWSDRPDSIMSAGRKSTKTVKFTDFDDDLSNSPEDSVWKDVISAEDLAQSDDSDFLSFTEENLMEEREWRRLKNLKNSRNNNHNYEPDGADYEFGRFLHYKLLEAKMEIDKLRRQNWELKRERAILETVNTPRKSTVESSLKVLPGTETSLKVLPGTQSTLQVLPGTQSTLKVLPGTETSLKVLPGTESTLQVLPGTQSTLQVLPGTQSTLQVLPGLQLRWSLHSITRYTNDSVLYLIIMAVFLGTITGKYIF